MPDGNGACLSMELDDDEEDVPVSPHHRGTGQTGETTLIETPAPSFREAESAGENAQGQRSAEEAPSFSRATSGLALEGTDGKKAAPNFGVEETTHECDSQEDHEDEGFAIEEIRLKDLTPPYAALLVVQLLHDLFGHLSAHSMGRISLYAHKLVRELPRRARLFSFSVMKSDECLGFEMPTESELMEETEAIIRSFVSSHSLTPLLKAYLAQRSRKPSVGRGARRHEAGRLASVDPRETGNSQNRRDASVHSPSSVCLSLQPQPGTLLGRPSPRRASPRGDELLSGPLPFPRRSPVPVVSVPGLHHAGRSSKRSFTAAFPDTPSRVQTPSTKPLVSPLLSAVCGKPSFLVSGVNYLAPGSNPQGLQSTASMLLPSPHVRGTPGFYSLCRRFGTLNTFSQKTGKPASVESQRGAHSDTQGTSFSIGAGRGGEGRPPSARPCFPLPLSSQPHHQPWSPPAPPPSGARQSPPSKVPTASAAVPATSVGGSTAAVTGGSHGLIGHPVWSPVPTKAEVRIKPAIIEGVRVDGWLAPGQRTGRVRTLTDTLEEKTPGRSGVPPHPSFLLAKENRGSKGGAKNSAIRPTLACNRAETGFGVSGTRPLESSNPPRLVLPQTRSPPRDLEFSEGTTGGPSGTAHVCCATPPPSSSTEAVREQRQAGKSQYPPQQKPSSGERVERDGVEESAARDVACDGKEGVLQGAEPVALHQSSGQKTLRREEDGGHLSLAAPTAKGPQVLAVPQVARVPEAFGATPIPVRKSFSFGTSTLGIAGTGHLNDQKQQKDEDGEKNENSAREEHDGEGGVRTSREPCASEVPVAQGSKECVANREQRTTVEIVVEADDDAQLRRIRSVREENSSGDSIHITSETTKPPEAVKPLETARSAIECGGTVTCLLDEKKPETEGARQLQKKKVLEGAHEHKLKMPLSSSPRVVRSAFSHDPSDTRVCFERHRELGVEKTLLSSTEEAKQQLVGLLVAATTGGTAKPSGSSPKKAQGPAAGVAPGVVWSPRRGEVIPVRFVGDAASEPKCSSSVSVQCSKEGESEPTIPDKGSAAEVFRASFTKDDIPGPRATTTASSDCTMRSPDICDSEELWESPVPDTTMVPDCGPAARKTDNKEDEKGRDDPDQRIRQPPARLSGLLLCETWKTEDSGSVRNSAIRPRENDGARALHSPGTPPAPSFAALGPASCQEWHRQTPRGIGFRGDSHVFCGERRMHRTLKPVGPKNLDDQADLSGEEGNPSVRRTGRKEASWARNTRDWHMLVKQQRDIDPLSIFGCGVKPVVFEDIFQTPDFRRAAQDVMEHNNPMRERAPDLLCTESRRLKAKKWYQDQKVCGFRNYEGVSMEEVVKFRERVGKLKDVSALVWDATWTTCDQQCHHNSSLRQPWFQKLHLDLGCSPAVRGGGASGGSSGLDSSARRMRNRFVSPLPLARANLPGVEEENEDDIASTNQESISTESEENSYYGGEKATVGRKSTAVRPTPEGYTRGIFCTTGPLKSATRGLRTPPFLRRPPDLCPRAENTQGSFAPAAAVQHRGIPKTRLLHNNLLLSGATLSAQRVTPLSSIALQEPRVFRQQHLLKPVSKNEGNDSSPVRLATSGHNNSSLSLFARLRGKG